MFRFLFCFAAAVVGLQTANCASPVIVIAHRGNHERAHENTVEAIRAAAAIGADYVEIDVRRTRDGHHVLMHDRTVGRMTGMEAAVDALSFEAIRQLTVRDPGRPEIAESRVPTFEEALDALGPRMGLYLDFKDGDPAFLAGELRKRDLIRRTVVYLEPEEIPAWKAAAPQLRFVVSLPEDASTPDTARTFMERYPDVILDGQVTQYTAELVRMAHTMGAAVWPDIQNPGENPEQWRRALQLGVDGLQTDHPSGLLTFLRDQGRHPAKGDSGRP